MPDWGSRVDATGERVSSSRGVGVTGHEPFHILTVRKERINGRNETMGETP